MLPTDQQSLIERIHATATPLVLAVTGGGAGAIAALLAVPGGSATLLEAVVPYSSAALEEWLGGAPDQAASERTARAMAMAAFERARQLTDGDLRKVRGIGATASLATNRPKRGAHRIHVAWQSADTTIVTSCELPKGERSRAEEEEIATQLVLAAVAEACGLEADGREQSATCLPRLEVDRREQHAPQEWSELLLGERNAVAIDASTSESESQSAIRNPKSAILFPGAFNPVHTAHDKMAEYAVNRYGQPVTWELSIANVDKPPLDFIEIADRLAGLAGRRVLVSRAASFAEKASISPGCTFIVGADTIVRIGERRYYDGNVKLRDAAISAIASRGCRFLVFGRMLGDRFCTLADVDVPPALRNLSDEVAESEFRHDAASSEIRLESHAAIERD